MNLFIMPIDDTTPHLSSEYIIENGIPTLDLVLSARLAGRWDIGLKARNLLNPAHSLTRKGNTTNAETVLSRYRKGADLSLGISYTL